MGDLYRLFMAFAELCSLVCVCGDFLVCCFEQWWCALCGGWVFVVYRFGGCVWNVSCWSVIFSGVCVSAVWGVSFGVVERWVCSIE